MNRDGLLCPPIPLPLVPALQRDSPLSAKRRSDNRNPVLAAPRSLPTAPTLNSHHTATVRDVLARGAVTQSEPTLLQKVLGAEDFSTLLLASCANFKGLLHVYTQSQLSGGLRPQTNSIELFINSSRATSDDDDLVAFGFRLRIALERF